MPTNIKSPSFPPMAEISAVAPQAARVGRRIAEVERNTINSLFFSIYPAQCI
jgi:hypothetical protein